MLARIMATQRASKSRTAIRSRYQEEYSSLLAIFALGRLKIIKSGGGGGRGGDDGKHLSERVRITERIRGLWHAHAIAKHIAKTW